MRTRRAGAQRTATPMKSPASKDSSASELKISEKEETSPSTVATYAEKSPEQSAGTEFLTGAKSVGNEETAIAASRKISNAGQVLDAEIDQPNGNEEVMEVKDQEIGRKQDTVSEKAECVDEGTEVTPEAGEVLCVKDHETGGKETVSEKVGECLEEGPKPTAEAGDALLEDCTDPNEEGVSLEVNAVEGEKYPVNDEYTRPEVEADGKPREGVKNVEEENCGNIQVIRDTKSENLETTEVKPANVEGQRKDSFQGDHVEHIEEIGGGDEGFEEYGDHIDFEDLEEEIPDDDTEEHAEDAQTLEAEHKEFTAAAKDSRIKKEHEIYVGGLGQDATEEDVKRMFEKIGEVVEVRLHKKLSANKNKGYAFVKFAKKEDAKRALSEMKNPVISGKRCMTAPREDNDILFLGNICNTWTKEAIRQKLKDYGVEGVENVTLVPNAQHEGHSRGFAFLEFSCHAEAMLAYKRLQKLDVIFGHPERTAKVAFAEPLREPDPEVMLKVKTVFLDGLLPQWDEDFVREQLKGYGEIVNIVLARNMSTAKRKDYGFVDFSTHEAAVSCIDGVNNIELADGKSKTKVKARLSNPLPKTQAIKGGMRGGFWINPGRTGRVFRRAGPQFNRLNFHPNRVVNRHGRGHIRMGRDDYGSGNRYPEHYGRQTVGRGGRRDTLRGAYHGYGGGFMAAGPPRSNFSQPWYGAPEIGPREPLFSSRGPFPSRQPFDVPFSGRHYNDSYDSYFYGEAVHGTKRPFYATQRAPHYMEPRRVRARPDFFDPVTSFRDSHYHDAYGAGDGFYPRDYYGSDHGAYLPYYGVDRSYRGGSGYYY